MFFLHVLLLLYCIGIGEEEEKHYYPCVPYEEF
jgi:hypothetical protein